MPMNSDSNVLVVAAEKRQEQEVEGETGLQQQQDSVDKSQSTSSSAQQQEKMKKPRKSLTSFSIFRRDKKFSESKIETPTKELAPRSAKNILVLDNTRLEVGFGLI